MKENFFLAEEQAKPLASFTVFMFSILYTKPNLFLLDSWYSLILQ